MNQPNQPEYPSYYERQDVSPEPKKASHRVPVSIVAVITAVGILLASAVTWAVALRQLRAPVSPVDTIPVVTAENAEESRETLFDPKTASENDVPQPVVIPISSSDGKSMTASEIYEKNLGSVVGIVSVGKSTNIFGQTTSSASAGTGFVIREDGYILTNYHVVEKGTELTVSFADGRTYEAEIVACENEISDLAVLKIDASGLVPVTFGASSDLTVGEDVVVIGNPLGELTFSLSKGVLSATERQINTDGTPITMLQIDAAVNAGNSGGPAFDAEGKVIGIVTAKYASESIEGLGFCIPAEEAAAMASDLIAYGYVRDRAAIGVSCADASVVYAYYYRYYGRKAASAIPGLLTEGVYVSDVSESGPAASADVKPGDYITAIEGEPVSDTAALKTILNRLSPGRTVTLTVSREGVSFDVTLTLIEYDPTANAYGSDSSSATV